MTGLWRVRVTNGFREYHLFLDFLKTTNFNNLSPQNFPEILQEVIQSLQIVFVSQPRVVSGTMQKSDCSDG
jgi:hypothetical protein